MMEVCTDNRFEIIEKAKKHILEATNINTSPEEMKLLDDFLFRCWQMGWLKQYDVKTNKNEKTFNIEVTMKERWIDDFCSMLKYMEKCGNIGHSCTVSFYSDGDGDFRPKFKIDTEFNETEGYRGKETKSEVFFDAG